jgi:hypothetical protein
MGMNLAIVTQTFGASEDQSWLGSAHGTNMADPVTLKASSFSTTWPGGVVPSGVVLGKITASGLYAPYASGNVDGSQTPLGHLMVTVDFTGGLTNLPSASWTDQSAALLFHGEVIVAKLPANSGHTGAVTTALPLIKYV